MRVLLTGASGFVGRHMASRLRRENIDFVSLGRSGPDNAAGRSIRADLLAGADHDEIVKRAEATHLIHLAWYAEQGQYWNSTLNLRWVEATIRLTESFCKAGGQHLSIAGTSAEYDWSTGYLVEDHSDLAPATMYGASKDATRRLVEAICRSHGVPNAWGRVFIPFGPGEDARRLVPSLHGVFQHKRPPFGVNAASYRDFIHVEDVASAFVELAKARAAGAFNISSGEPTLIADLVRHVAGLYGADPAMVLKLSSDRPGEPRLIVGANEKLKALGWVPASTKSMLFNQGKRVE